MFENAFDMWANCAVSLKTTFYEIHKLELLHQASTGGASLFKLIMLSLCMIFHNGNIIFKFLGQNKIEFRNDNLIQDVTWEDSNRLRTSIFSL